MEKVGMVKVMEYPDGRMDAQNAAAYVGKTVKTMAMYRCAGTGPKFIKSGGKIFYYREDLDAWLREGGRVSSTAQARMAAA
jgi:Helix-turn-helix domain